MMQLHMLACVLCWMLQTWVMGQSQSSTCGRLCRMASTTRGVTSAMLHISSTRRCLVKQLMALRVRPRLEAILVQLFQVCVYFFSSACVVLQT